jgi:hypothetical protein
MIKFGIFATTAAFIVCAPAFAQSAPATTSSADVPVPVDAGRLVQAKRLIAELAPPEKRDAMIDSIMRPMMANIRHGLEDSAEYRSLFADQPQLRDVMVKFIDAETEHSIKLAREAMPALYEAMATAYARRFSTEQLNELERFFETPTGQAYAAQAATIMSDPDIMAAQRAMMTKSLDGLQDRLRAMTRQMVDQAKKKGKS